MCCAIWGSTFLFISLGNRTVPPFWAAALRLGAASVVLSAVLALSRRPWPRGRGLATSMVFGLFQFGIQFALLYWGETRVPSGLAGVVYATIPLSTAVYARATGLERLDPVKVVGALLALAGVAVIFHGQMAGGVPLLPLLSLLAAASIASLATVILKRGPRIPALAVNAVATPVGAAVCLAFSFASGEPHAWPASWPEVYPILYLTVMGSLIAFVVFAWLVNHWEATRISYIAVIVPVVALFLGAVVGRERLGAGEWIGSAVVLAGVMIGLRVGWLRRAAPAA